MGEVVLSGKRWQRVVVLVAVGFTLLAVVAIAEAALANPNTIGTPFVLGLGAALLVPLVIVLRKTCWRLTLTDSGILGFRIVGGRIGVPWEAVSGVRVLEYRTIASGRRVLRIAVRERPRIDVFDYMFSDFDRLRAELSRRLGDEDEGLPRTLFERLWLRSARR